MFAVGVIALYPAKVICIMFVIGVAGAMPVVTEPTLAFKAVCVAVEIGLLASEVLFTLSSATSDFVSVTAPVRVLTEVTPDTLPVMSASVAIVPDALGRVSVVDPFKTREPSFCSSRC